MNLEIIDKIKAFFVYLIKITDLKIWQKKTNLLCPIKKCCEFLKKLILFNQKEKIFPKVYRLKTVFFLKKNLHVDKNIICAYITNQLIVNPIQS